MTRTAPAERFKRGHIEYTDFGHCIYYKQEIGRNVKGREVHGKRWRITKAEFEAARNI